MAKIYIIKNVVTPKLLPKKEIILFLLNYSKVFSILKVGKLKFENFAN